MAEEDTDQDTDQDVESTNIEGEEEETAEAAVEENDEFASEEGNDKTTDNVNGESASLDLILDIPLTVTVELGRSKMLINDLLQLGQGSVVELTKLVGDPLEVLVNNKLVARGEVVVVNEKFGVRLTDIVTPMERVKSLAT
jgi:flagellar motor switch protein FliN/FliY